MSEVKKISVFGGTGTVGLFVLDQAISLGLEVTALLRDETKLPSNLQGKLKVIVGNVLNQDDVDKTVADSDGVVVILGTRNKLEATTEMSKGTENIVAAMKKNNIRRVSICLSSFLLLEPDKVPAIFNEINAEHGRMLNVLESSGLDYIAVLPPHFGDNPKGVYLVKENALPGGRVVAKPDLADFMINSLSKTDLYGKKIGISSVLN